MQQRSESEWMDERLDRALERLPPDVVIPHDFAARMAALVPARRELPASRLTYGRVSVIVCAVALLAGLLLLAPHASGWNFATAIEWILCAQLSLLALFFAWPGSPFRLSR